MHVRSPCPIDLRGREALKDLLGCFPNEIGIGSRRSKELR